MSYESWRISYQDSEQAAKAAYRENADLRKQLEQAESRISQMEQDGLEGEATFANLVERLEQAEARCRELEQELRMVERRAKVYENDFPILSAFYTEYALGPLAPPSCLVCGHELWDEPAVKHLRLPGIVVCKRCKSAADKALSPTERGEGG